MQTQQTQRLEGLQARLQLSIVLLAASLTLVSMLGCESGKSSFNAAVERSRVSLVDQVQAIGEGAPFYAVKSLDPIWNLDGVTEIVKIPKLSLVDQNGVKRTEAHFQGKTTMVAFMFASCAGFCPMLVKNLQRVEKELGAKKNLQFVLLTVDPEHDTPAALRTFASKMQLTPGRWTLLTGDRETIYSLARENFASQAFQRVGATPRRFVHSEHFYVIDEAGRLRGVLNGNRMDVTKEASKIIAQVATPRREVEKRVVASVPVPAASAVATEAAPETASESGAAPVPDVVTPEAVNHSEM